MNSAKHGQATGRKGRSAGALLRLCAVLWLVVYIVYTPIHLCLEPHFEEAVCSATTAASCVGDADHDGDDHGDQHAAAQHKLKALRSARTVVAEIVLITAVEWVEAEKECPLPQVFEFSGLSPPELPRCWQFIFRAALPIRAPSVLA